MWLKLKANLFKNQSPDNFFSYSLEPVPALEPTPLWNQFQHLLEPELELESQLSEKTSKFGTGTDSRFQAWNRNITSEEGDGEGVNNWTTSPQLN